MNYINFAIEDRVGRIAFTEPPLNIFNIAMMKEISGVLNECMGRHELVAIVFEAGPGSRAFGAGVSIEEHGEETIYQMLESFHSIFRNLEQLAKPAIAVVDGVALGGGCELVLACDIVVASERSKFGQPEIKLGVFPPVACVLLPRIIGEKRARELILTGELIDANDALKLGMISYVVPQENLAAKTAEILGKFRELSGPSLEATRRALDMARGRSFEDGLKRIEDLYLNDLMKTEDAREGIQAFMDKRKPDWRNR
jgi:cyclohexa-1,5-dienecarbonyl-CoA hydratase